MKRRQGGIARRAGQWFCALAAAALPAFAWAAGACVAAGGIGGIGGTGAPVEHGGIGGTGSPRTADNGGIGGTGAPIEHGGIGGTGQQASGLGIVGIVTGFGSVCVDDLEVRFDTATPVSRNGQPTGLDRLAIGQVVAIEASSGSRGLTAQRISIVNAVEGPVTRVDARLATIYVMDQPVRLTEDTQLAGFDAFDQSIVGLPVRVAGYRNAGDQVVASRIELARDLGEVSLTGAVGRDDRGGPTVGGQPVRSTAALPPAGTETLVRGRWDGSRIVAGSATSDPSLPFAGRVGRVVVEGLVVRQPTTGRVGISGFDVRYSSATPLAGGRWSEAQEGRRMRIVGTLGPGRSVRAEHIQMMPLTRWGMPMMRTDEMGHPMPGGMGQSPMGSPGGMGGGGMGGTSGGGMGGGGFGGGGMGGGGMGGGGMGGRR